MISRHAIILNVLINPIENVWNIMQKEIGYRMPCNKEILWKRVFKAWNSVAPEVLEEPYNSMRRRIADLIKAKGGAMNY